jgi:hypothetical protein
MITGGCHCGAIRYQAEGEALTHALCHCTDCRRHAGAPIVGWTMYPQGQGDEGHTQGVRILGTWPATLLRRLWHRATRHESNPVGHVTRE